MIRDGAKLGIKQLALKRKKKTRNGTAEKDHLLELDEFNTMLKLK